ncbi:SigE family RNA polymerase sigma factor [Nocardioides nanhaiensis]|uniref:SigE family RNA polymerase sigma factor n=1 Tax=Nocardioides nanhaiensis TaxID=1476871 RepID=A0ABP8VXJ7_9ACTN
MPRPHDDDFVAFATASMPDLRRTGYLVCGDWHRAEDAAQEALVRLYGAWDRVERREGLLAYARRSTVRVLIDESRRPWRRRETSSPMYDHDVVQSDPADGVLDRDAVVRGLAGLSPRRRACLVLRYYQQLSVAETARVLGCSEGTVKSQTADALRALRPLVGGTVPATTPTTRSRR